MNRPDRLDWKFTAWLMVSVLAALTVVVFIRGKAANRPSIWEYDPDHSFTIQDLREDFEVLETTLKEAHGNLYAHINPADFKKAVQDVRRKLDRAMTELEFLRALSPLVSAIGCGHTHLKPSREYEEIYDTVSGCLPYVLVVIQKRLYIAHEILPAKKSLQGFEIISINGRSAQSVMDRILADMSGDGAIRTQKLKKLGKYFSWYWNIYIGDKGGFKLVLRAPDGRTTAIETDSITRPLFREKLSGPNLEAENLLLDFKPLAGSGTSLLRMKTLYTVALKKLGFRYKKFFSKMFRQIKENEIDNLIIDIRGNEGGSLYMAAELLSYLFMENFRVLERYRTSSTLRLTHKKFIGRDPFITFKWLVTQKKEGWRNFPWFRLLKIQKTKKRLRFKGNVFVLIDGETYSSASLFAALLRSRENTFFVGEETGGSSCGNGVSPIHLTLPHTQLRMQIPFGYVKPAVLYAAECSRGVIPDYIIAETLNSLSDGSDPAMDFVLNMVRHGPPGQSPN